MNTKHRGIWGVMAVGLCLFTALFVVSRRGEDTRRANAEDSLLDAEGADPGSLSAGLSSETPKRQGAVDELETQDSGVGLPTGPNVEESKIQIAEKSVLRTIEDSLANQVDYAQMLDSAEALLSLEVSHKPYMGIDVGDGIRFPLEGTSDEFDAFLLLRNDIDQIALEIKIQTSDEEPYIVNGYARATPRLLVGGRFDSAGEMTFFESISQMNPHYQHNMANGVDIEQVGKLNSGMTFGFPMDDPYSWRAREILSSSFEARYSDASPSIVGSPQDSMEQLRRIAERLAYLKAQF